MATLTNREVRGHYGAGYMDPSRMPTARGGAGYMEPASIPAEIAGGGWMNPIHMSANRR